VAAAVVGLVYWLTKPVNEEAKQEEEDKTNKKS